MRFVARSTDRSDASVGKGVNRHTAISSGRLALLCLPLLLSLQCMAFASVQVSKQIDHRRNRITYECAPDYSHIGCTERSPTATYVVLPALTADIYILYAASVANPYYGFGYFGLSYMGLGMLSKHPIGYDRVLRYEEWHGHPNEPLSESEDTFYTILHRPARSDDQALYCSELINAVNRKAITLKAFKAKGIALNEDRLKDITQNSEMILLAEDIDGYEKTVCLFAYQAREER